MSPIKVQPYLDIYQDQVIQLIFNFRTEFNIPMSIQEQSDLLKIPEVYQQRSGNFWVALDGDQVVGTIGLIDIGNNQGCVKKVFVDSRYRSNEKKTAKFLLDTLIHWCREKNIRDIYLGTRAVFLAAHRFYEKNGFKEISKETLPHSYPTNPPDSKFYVYHIKI